MSHTVSITDLSGGTYFSVWVGTTCNINNRIFVGEIDTTVSEEPYVFNIPHVFENSLSYCVQVYNLDNCLMCKCFS